MKQDTPATTENLDGLIQKIQTEGVETGKRQAEAMLAAARREAAALVEKAEGQARGILQEAEVKAKELAANSREAQRKAARDLLLSVRESLANLLRQLMRQDVQQRLQGKTLEGLILEVTQAWMEKGGRAHLEVLVGEKDRELLTNGFLQRLKTTLASGVDLKVHADLEGGFRVYDKEGALTLDFSDAALAEALGALIHPRFTDLFESCLASAPTPPTQVDDS